MLKLQWGLIGVLAFGGVGHLAGTLISYPPGTEIFVWSLTAVFYVFAVVFLQALRLTRKNDRLIRAGATAATAAWMLLALAFGAAIGDKLIVRRLTRMRYSPHGSLHPSSGGDGISSGNSSTPAHRR